MKSAHRRSLRRLANMTPEPSRGAVAYQVGYYPLLLCWVKRPNESGPGFSWEFTAEEV